MKTTEQIKADSPHAVLEESGTAFDPSTQYLDLTKEEKRRTTALLMAIQAYQHLIIKDAEMYYAIKKDEDRGDGPKIRPATMDAMVHGALQFDDFISGKLQERLSIQSQSVGTEPHPVQGVSFEFEKQKK